MKRIFFLIVLGVALYNCGNSESDNAKPIETADAPAMDPDAKKGLQLVANSDCFQCHQVKATSQGPAYEAVAARYPNNQQSIDTLASKIIHGGAGNWGTIPMIAHPDISKEDAQLMAKYVLSLKQ
jgi:cytochrome c